MWRPASRHRSSASKIWRENRKRRQSAAAAICRLGEMWRRIEGGKACGEIRRIFGNRRNGSSSKIMAAAWRIALSISMQCRNGEAKWHRKLRRKKESGVYQWLIIEEKRMKIWRS